MAQQISGQITVVTAGTEVQGPNIKGGRFALKAHPDNTDTVWVGNDGANALSSTTGFPLNPGETIIRVTRNLNELWFDADVNGAKVCWFMLES